MSGAFSSISERLSGLKELVLLVTHAAIVARDALGAKKMTRLKNGSRHTRTTGGRLLISRRSSSRRSIDRRSSGSGS